MNIGQITRSSLKIYIITNACIASSLDTDRFGRSSIDVKRENACFNMESRPRIVLKITVNIQ